MKSLVRVRRTITIGYMKTKTEIDVDDKLKLRTRLQCCWGRLLDLSLLLCSRGPHYCYQRCTIPGR